MDGLADSDPIYCEYIYFCSFDLAWMIILAWPISANFARHDSLVLQLASMKFPSQFLGRRSRKNRKKKRLVDIGKYGFFSLNLDWFLSSWLWQSQIMDCSVRVVKVKAISATTAAEKLRKFTARQEAQYDRLRHVIALEENLSDIQDQHQDGGGGGGKVQEELLGIDGDLVHRLKLVCESLSEAEK